MKRGKRGFTMIELLAVLVILGVIMVIAVPSVVSYLQGSKTSYYNQLEESVKTTGQEYFSDHRSLLPRENGQILSVDINDLVTEGYTTEILDSDGNNTCTGTVYVKRLATADFEYHACIQCGKKDSKGEQEFTSTDTFCTAGNQGGNPDGACDKPKDNPLDDCFMIQIPNSFKVPQCTTVEDSAASQGISLEGIVLNNGEDIGDRVPADTTKVDYKKIGNYKVYYTYKQVLNASGDKYNFSVSVYDDKAPGDVEITMHTDSESGALYNCKSKENCSWTGKDVYITFTANDMSDCGTEGSGIKQFAYRYGSSGNWQTVNAIKQNGKYKATIVRRTTYKGTLEVKAIDNAQSSGASSNFESAVTSGYLMVDKTPPSCTSSGGNTNWINAASNPGTVILTGTCNDAHSGCKERKITKEYSTDIDSTTESPGIVYDNVGNSTVCPGNRTVKIDKTAPSCTNSGGSNTWTSGAITLIGTCKDNLSGCRSNVSKKYDYEINSTKESPGTVYDIAGNKTECPGNQSVKIDKTPPTCTSSGGDSTWTSGSRTLTGTCSDNLSGCRSNVTKRYDYEINSTRESPGTVYDLAGNKTVCPGNQTVKIDQTPPTCTSSGGDSTWTSGSRTLTGTCRDNLSGCQSNVSKQYNSEINSTSESPGTVYDLAGNKTVCPGNQTVKIDKTPPTCTSSGGDNAWTAGARILTGTCGDNLSGCRSNVTKRYDYQINSTTESPGTVYDNAGNSVTCPGNQTVRIDKTAPTCSSSGGSSSVVFGSITLTGTCYDNESGCQGNVSKNFSGPQTLYNQSPGTVCDNVGHCTTCPANQTINIGIPEIVGGNACQSGLNVVWTVHGSSAHGGGSGGCGSVSLRTNWEGSGNVSIDSNDIPTYGARKVIISGHGGMKHYDAISVCVSGQCRSASGENPDDVPDHTWSYEWNISGKSTIQISLSGRNQNDGDAFATINSIRFEM